MAVKEPVAARAKVVVDIPGPLYTINCNLSKVWSLFYMDPENGMDPLVMGLCHTIQHLPCIQHVGAAPRP